MPVEEIAPGILQGYSPALDLFIRWEHGLLEWWDPHTGAPIPSWEDGTQARLRAESRADAASARLSELEEENQRLRQQLADGAAEPSR